MIGEALLGTTLFGMEGNTQEVVTTTPLLSYNDYSFDSENVRIGNLDITTVNNIAINSYDLALEHGAGFDSYFLKPKSITVEGIIKADTPEDLETQISNFKGALLQDGKTLERQRSDGTVVTTTAYCESISIPREYFHVTFTPFTVKLITLEPFFYRNSTSEEIVGGQTSDFSGSVVYLEGEYDARPTFTFTFNTASVSEVELTMNGSTITVSETIADGDVLVIDCKGKDVLVNSTGGKDYTGDFPTLPIGEIAYDIAITGTFDVDLSISWNDTYT